jgi:ABC-type branched-subunit amino acid transport system substrate-binding protein
MMGRHMRRKAAATAVVSVAVLALAACGSSNSATGGDGNDGGGSGNTGALKIGLMYSQTGPSSETFKETGKAVEARWQAYQDSGGKCASRQITWDDGDDTNTPQGALSLAQKFVQQDHIDILIQSTAEFFGASQYMTTDPTAKTIPVIGGGYDTNAAYFDKNNLIFPALTPQSYKVSYTQPGDFFKSKGVTKIAGIAYSIASSADALNQSMKSFQNAGISVGYENDKIAYGSKDVNAIVQGIVQSHADGFYTTLNPDTALAVLGGAEQAGVKFKAVEFPIGYGPELLASKPAVEASQGVTFSTELAPYDLHTKATDALAADLKKYLGNDSGLPTFAESQGWLAGDEFIYGLEKAGCNATPAQIAAALRSSNSWDAGGLLAQPRDFTTTADPSEQCSYLVTLKGEDFVPESKKPFCGTQISG